jgi:hypothetical protein
MHALLFHRQNALADDCLRWYAAKLGLDVARFDRDRTGRPVLERVRRDVRSGSATGQLTGTPTLFIGGVVHRGQLHGGRTAAQQRRQRASMPSEKSVPKGPRRIAETNSSGSAHSLARPPQARQSALEVAPEGRERGSPAPRDRTRMRDARVEPVLRPHERGTPP